MAVVEAEAAVDGVEGVEVYSRNIGAEGTCAGTTAVICDVTSTAIVIQSNGSSSVEDDGEEDGTVTAERFWRVKRREKASTHAVASYGGRTQARGR